MSPEIQCVGMTDRGLRRPDNQDQFLVARLDKSMTIDQSSLDSERCKTLHSAVHGHLLVVADGMGGHAGGERASQIAIDGVTLYALNMIPWFFQLSHDCEHDFQDDLKRALEYCHRCVQDECAREPGYRGMGTTLTMGYLVWPFVYTVHVGDSRGYLYREGMLQRLTRDHTVAQQLVDDGQLAREQVESSPLSHVIWNAIGGSSQTALEPEVAKVRLQPQDALLLCTDGLTRHLDDRQIAEILAHRSSLQQTCRDLIDAANAAGGSDNITVVLATCNPTRGRAGQSTCAVAAEPGLADTDAHLALGP